MTLTKSTPDHVLIVDDQEYTLESARAVMESVGYEVATLSDPTKALQLLHDFREGQNPIDLVITDLDMPRLNGEELTSRISFGFSRWMNACRLLRLPITGSGLSAMLLLACQLPNGACH